MFKYPIESSQQPSEKAVIVSPWQMRKLKLIEVKQIPQPEQCGMWSKARDRTLPLQLP